MKTWLLATLTLTSISAFAALPPNYESARRIKAVLDAPALMQQVGVIDAIKAVNNNGGYLVTSNNCTVEVLVTCGKMPGHFVGPCPLILKVGKKDCRHIRIGGEDEAESEE